MPSLNEVFNRIKQAQKNTRDLDSVYKDALSTSKPYQETLTQLKDLRIRKAQLETSIKADFTQETVEMDRLKEHVKTDKQLLTDMAITQMMKGQTVEVKDEHDATYEPMFSVRFKKTDVITSSNGS